MSDAELIAKARGWASLNPAMRTSLTELIDALAARQWRPIETAPRDGTFILLAGPSGYVTTPLRAEVCRYYPEYRPRNPWQTHSDDAFTDGGEDPTHWMPLPDPPEPKP